ncbi:MAG: hypothetical protein QOF33_41, partial [Thermomicrobiales bacterium]|nr:hypothetical protein [Thermomicrobiales bacterium]
MSRRSLAALIPVGLVAMLLSPVLAAAQEASPGAELGPPSAAECQ